MGTAVHLEIEAPTTVKSADRVLDFFERLANAGCDMTHTEIAQTLGIPKSSLSKLLKNLVQRRFVEYMAETKGYRLGPVFLDLAQRAAASRDITALSTGTLKETMQAAGESCSLSLLRTDEIEAVAAVDAPHRLLYHLNVGDRVPLYASSGGKAILAFLPEQERVSYLARAVIRPLTPFTLRDTAALAAEIEVIRQEGAAYSRQEVTAGVISIGVPVLSRAGRPLAAINVAMPTVRFDDVKRMSCVAALRRGADRLRALLGEGSSAS